MEGRLADVGFVRVRLPTRPTAMCAVLIAVVVVVVYGLLDVYSAWGNSQWQGQGEGICCAHC